MRRLGLSGWTRRCAALAVATAVATVPVVSARPAWAASKATVAGTVVNGTTGKLAPGLKVTLAMTRAGAAVSERFEITRADGSFAFRDLDGGSPWSYAITAKYAGADYRSDPVTPEAGKTATVTLKIYEPTSTPADIRLDEWVVWVDRESGVAIQHDIRISNTGKKTYTGSRDLVDGKKAVIPLPLAPGARNLQYLGILMECCSLARDDNYFHTRPIPPGTIQGTMRYNVNSLKELVLPVPFPTRNLTLLVPAEITVKAKGLKRGDEIQDRGISYQVFTARDVKAGRRIKIGLSGLAPRRIPWAAITLLGIILAAGGAFFGLRRLPAPPAKQAGKGARATSAGASRARPANKAPSPPKTPARTAAPGPPPASASIPGLRPQSANGPSAPVGGTLVDADLLVEELAALDLAHERGLISERVYRELRSARKAELITIRQRQREAP